MYSTLACGPDLHSMQHTQYYCKKLQGKQQLDSLILLQTNAPFSKGSMKKTDAPFSKGSVNKHLAWVP
jgi:hypothetical protein